MTLQQFLDSYHLDTDGDYDDRHTNAQCFVCDALEHPSIYVTTSEAISFANTAFNVTL